jgi:ribonuclease BN (tRNA processing enzyme)
MADKAGCKKLVLTHLYPVCADYDLASECRQTYGGDVVAAEDGMPLDLG